mmetsp:Transcript_41016/g.94992  ORF Transcript_41016/g.94992 Transcript_41016/m.94992 type:complete len:223 (-) Transcript_41016:614-1282(-)
MARAAALESYFQDSRVCSLLSAQMEPEAGHIPAPAGRPGLQTAALCGHTPRVGEGPTPRCYSMPPAQHRAEHGVGARVELAAQHVGLLCVEDLVAEGVHRREPVGVEVVVAQNRARVRLAKAEAEVLSDGDEAGGRHPDRLARETWPKLREAAVVRALALGIWQVGVAQQQHDPAREVAPVREALKLEQQRAREFLRTLARQRRCRHAVERFGLARVGVVRR